MPKTRLTAKLCNVPTQKSPVLEGPKLLTHVKCSPEDVSRILANASCIDFCLYKDACDSLSDSDTDEDDLPEAQFLSEASSSMPARGDPVWVKHRHYNFWPSLVVRQSPRSKKLRILFLDDSPMNGQHKGEKICMKYNKEKVLPYNHEKRSKFEAEGKLLESPEQQKRFQGALDKMVDYLGKRALGHTSACKAFLNDSTSSEDEEDTTLTPGDLPLPTPAQPAPSATKVQPETPKRKKKKEEAERTEVVEDKKRKRNVITPAERRAVRRDKNQPLVDFICSPEMKEYLSKIYRGEIPSERHSMFRQGSSQQRKIQTNSSGPIDDDEQLETIVDFIGNVYQNLTQQKMPNMDYLFWVLLPEAIIHALAKIKRCGQKKAAEIFERGVKLTKSEHLEIHEQLLRK